MSVAVIKQSVVRGSVKAPCSKSVMQRACAAALIAKGKTRISHGRLSSDELSALAIVRQLGAEVSNGHFETTIFSTGVRPVNALIDCGESGLALRMFTPIAALSPQAFTITGHGSLLNRPVNVFSEIFPFLNVRYADNNGLLPLTVTGPLEPRSITINGSLSSQFLTGLIMAYSAARATGVAIDVQGLVSKQYVDLTMETLAAFGLPVPSNDNYTRFVFNGGNQSDAKAERQINVEGDWSGASFLLVAGAVGGDVVVDRLNAFSMQPDKAILSALMQAQAFVSVQETSTNTRSNRLTAFQFDATDCPDLFPPLVALAVCCNGTSVITGVNRLKFKESNRAATLVSEFGKMNAELTIQDDLLVIKGNAGLRGNTVTSHGDHRIAMACAIAALNANGETRIRGAEAVAKSYPGFWDDLRSLGADVYLSD